MIKYRTGFGLAALPGAKHKLPGELGSLARLDPRLPVVGVNELQLVAADPGSIHRETAVQVPNSRGLDLTQWI